MLTGLKDSAMSLALKAYLNDRFKEYGEVLDCDIDTTTGRISLRALMRGESAPVSASVEQYEVKRDSEGPYIVLQQFSSSRAWLTTLLNALFCNKRYPIPSVLGALL